MLSNNMQLKNGKVGCKMFKFEYIAYGLLAVTALIVQKMEGGGGK